MLSKEKQAEVFTDGFALRRTVLTNKDECVAWRMGWEVRRVVDRFFATKKNEYVDTYEDALFFGIKTGVMDDVPDGWRAHHPSTSSGIKIGAAIRRHHLDALQSLLHGG